MATPFQRTYTSFVGGINQRLGPVILDNGDVEALLFCNIADNWECSELGLLKRPGWIAVLASAISGTPKITGLFEYVNPTGALELIACAGTKIYSITGSTATEILSGQTAGAYYQATQWDDGAGTEVIILMNGVDTPVEYDGTTCGAVSFTDPDNIWDGATPKGAAVFRNRIFYWGDPTYKYRLYTPRPGTYNNFDNTTLEVDAFDIDAGFGGSITGVRTLTDDFLVIYKERAIRRLAGSAPFGSAIDEFALADVTDNFGCIAPLSLVGNEIEHYFLAEDGLRQLKPIESYGDVDPQQPTYLVPDLVGNINFTRSVVQNACAVFDKTNRQIWLSVPTGSSSTNTQILHYDIITKGIDVRPIAQATASYLAVFNRKLYHGDYAGQIFRHGDTNGNNGANITATWEGKYIAHYGISSWKRYKDIFIYADSDSSGDVIVQWRLLRRGQEQLKSESESIGGASSLWDVAQWDVAQWASSKQAVFHIKNPGRGNAIQLRFLNTSSSQRPKIRQVDIHGEVFGTRKG